MTLRLTLIVCGCLGLGIGCESNSPQQPAAQVASAIDVKNESAVAPDRPESAVTPEASATDPDLESMPWDHRTIKTDVDVKQLIESRWNPKEGVLTISGDLENADLEFLSRLTGLQSVGFQDHVINAKAISRLPVLRSVTWLTFDKCKISAGSFRDLPELPAMIDVSFMDSTIEPSDIGLFVEKYKSRIEKIDFFGSDVTDKAIALLPPCLKLNELNVDCCKNITRAAVPHICKIKSLRRLHISLPGRDRAKSAAREEIIATIKAAIPGIGISQTADTE